MSQCVTAPYSVCKFKQVSISSKRTTVCADDPHLKLKMLDDTSCIHACMVSTTSQQDMIYR